MSILFEIPGPGCPKSTISCGSAFDFGRYDRCSYASNETSKSGRWSGSFEICQFSGRIDWRNGKIWGFSPWIDDSGKYLHKAKSGSSEENLISCQP